MISGHDIFEGFVPAPLGGDEVHVWQLPLDALNDRAEVFFKALSEDERERAKRFATADGRERYITGRGQLRILLGGYLDESPESLQFRYLDKGKPVLVERDLHFNFSHCRDRALCAVTCLGRVGVDIEHPRDSAKFEEIARRFFSRAEVEELMKIEASERRRAFFVLWCRKEAFVKALGGGISMRLDHFSLRADPEISSQAPIFGDLRPDSTEWTVESVPLDDGYLAACAVEARSCIVKQFQTSMPPSS